MLKQVQKFIEHNDLIHSGETIIVAVSGGPDSMALLHLMRELSSRLNFNIVAAHLNHGLRPEAASEELFVINTCKLMAVECYTKTVMIEELARQRKAGLEETGRNARYDFFEQLRAQTNAQRIATAHHRDDVAESVLLHLLRGTGVKGLRGILPINGYVIRPLLRVGKDELLEYLAANSLTYCQDESNKDEYYLRNRIRHGLIPYLQQEFNPRIVDKLNQLAVIAGDENQVMEAKTEELWLRMVQPGMDSTINMDNQILLDLPRAFQRRIVKKALDLTAAAEWNMEDVEKILDLSAREKVGSAITLQLKKKVRVIKSYDKIIFTTQLPDRAYFLHELSVPETVQIDAVGLAFQIKLVNREECNLEPGAMYLDYEKLPSPIYLRSRQNGDYYLPVGMKGTKKLKKYFIDQKVPYYNRDGVVLLSGAGHEIYAALGYFISKRALVNTDTELVLEIKQRPL